MTEISDEMVEAALAAADFCTNPGTRRWMRAALAAAEAVRSKTHMDDSSAYASGYAAAREQAAGVAQNGDWEFGEGVHAGTPRDIAAAIRKMEPNT